MNFLPFKLLVLSLLAFYHFLKKPFMLNSAEYEIYHASTCTSMINLILSCVLLA